LVLFVLFCGLLIATSSVTALGAEDATMTAADSDHNPAAPNVLEQFYRLQLNGDPFRFHPGVGDVASNCRHYQGMARINAPDGTPYLVLSRSGKDTGTFCIPDGDFPGELLVVEMGTRDRDGERLRSNILAPGEEFDDTPPPVADRGVFHVHLDSDTSDGWPEDSHPGGIQIVGDVLVVALSDGFLLAKVNFTRKDSIGGGEPRYNVELSPLNTIRHYGAGSVAVARVPGGPPSPYPGDRYLFAVAAEDVGARFYWSDGADLDEVKSLEYLGFWDKAGLGVKSGYWRRWEMLNLVTDANGTLYLIGTENTTSFLNGDDWAGLFQLDVSKLDPEAENLDGAVVAAWQREFDTGTELALDQVNLGNFDAASGVYVSPTGQLILYSAAHDNEGTAGSVEAGEFRDIEVYYPETSPRESMCPWAEFYEDRTGWANTPPHRSLMLDFKDRRIEDHWYRLDAEEGFGDDASSMKWYLAPGQLLDLYYDEHWTGPRIRLTGTGKIESVSNLDLLQADGDNEIDSVFMGPLADPGGPYNAQVGVPVTLDDAGHCYRPELTGPFAPAYTWSVADPASGCTFYNPNASRPTLACAEQGTYEIQLKVTETDYLWRAGSHESTTTITVTVPQQAPTVRAGPDRSLEEGGTVRVAATFTDPNRGDTHTATIDWGDGSPVDTVETRDGTATGSHTYPDNGKSVVTVEVCDAFGCGNDSFTATVDNVAPTPDAGLDVSTVRNEPVTVSGSWQDPAGDRDGPYSWSWDLDGDGVFDDTGTGSVGDRATVTTSFPTVGRYLLTFQVEDHDGGIGVDTVTIKVGHQAPSFVDDDVSIFEDDIEWIAARGITLGCNPPRNNRYCPDNYVTRGQMAAFLVRAMGYPDNPAGDRFVDDNTSIFEDDIERLAAAGVTKGCNPPTNTRYCPNSYVTRGQMAAFLVRAMGYTDNPAGDRFVDDNDSIFEDDIERLAAAGVTRGCNPPTNTKYCPNGHVTRGEMAALLHRAIE
jgi:hypothetical protein